MKTILIVSGLVIVALIATRTDGSKPTATYTEPAPRVSSAPPAGATPHEKYLHCLQWAAQQSIFTDGGLRWCSLSLPE
jgi:hypothetical protein